MNPRLVLVNLILARWREVDFGGQWYTAVMPKRSSRSSDPNSLAASIVQEATADPATKKIEKNAAAVALGRLGGLKGGNARAASLTARRRKEIAKRAARSRWNKTRRIT